MTEPEPEPVGARLRRWDPERIGPYVILGRLGAGSMGQVFLGRSAAGRLVAVKTIRVDLAEEAGFRTRFAQEVAAARRVSGFFTAAVVEADPDADLPWLATAYVAAPSLSRLVRACGPLPVAAVRWLAAGCAEALDSIHRVGLVHRDLKPSNVLVAPDGPRVIDFGVARAAERMGTSTSHGTVGTPAYMAPEQAHEAAPGLSGQRRVLPRRHAGLRGDRAPSLSRGHDHGRAGPAGHRGARPVRPARRARPARRRLHAARAGGAPTSSAVLAQLGQFAETRPDPAGEHSYLPGPGHGPGRAVPAQSAARGGTRGRGGSRGCRGHRRNEDSADVTAASYPELPASGLPGPGWPEAAPGTGPGPRRPGGGRAGGSGCAPTWPGSAGSRSVPPWS